MVLSQSMQGQVVDDFNDSNLAVNPSWQVTPNGFTTINGELRSNHSTLNSSFYMSTPSNFIKNCIWQLDTRLLFNPSSANYVDIMLCADSANILNAKNGYFIRLGSSADDICLYKTKGGIDTKVIDGTDGVLNTSNNPWRITVTKLNNHTFTLERQHIVNGSIAIEGIAKDSDIISSQYFGIRIRQSTASFVNKHFFDNLSITSIFKDTIAPLVDSCLLNKNNELLVYFSEPCDTISMLDVNNYKIVEGNIFPKNILKVNNKCANVVFNSTLEKNITLHLSIQNICDTLLNVMRDTLLPFYYSRPDTARERDLLITEIMADPDPIVGLPNKEYLEFKNVSGKYINLNGCRIYDPSGYKPLPNYILPPDSFIVLYNIPSLNNGGDVLWLTNQLNEKVHNITYTLDWYKDKNKTNGGWSLEMKDLTYPCNSSINWAESNDINGGTPGKKNSIDGKINDIVSPKIISFFAVNDSILKINFNEELDSNLIINAMFKINGIPSALNLKQINKNETFWKINFTPNADSIYSIEISNVKDCSGNTMNKTLKIQWPSTALKNDVIVNEVLFNPSTGENDFIELYNNSNKAIDLSKLFLATMDKNGQYKSIDKIGNTNEILLPKHYLLLSSDTISICQKYTCTATTNLKLNYNKMPSLPDDKGNLVLVNSNNLIIDSMAYSEEWHNPLITENNGVSLERLSFIAPTFTKTNWYSAASTAGYATPGYLNSQQINTKTSAKVFELASKTISPDGDGFEDVLILNYNIGKPNYAATINIYNTQGTLIKQVLNNETLATQGFITWNGTDYNNQKANMGIYIITIECVNTDGNIIKEKLSCVVAGVF